VALGGPSNLHLDIITGRDTKIDIDDIYNGTLQFLEVLNLTFRL